MAGVASHEILDLGSILKGTSPLVDKTKEVGHYASTVELPEGIEPTFVPGRNLLFLVLAANRAVALGAEAMVIGVSQEDYGGYPDCRRDFISRMQEAIGLGVYGSAQAFGIHTPLLHMSKMETVKLARSLGGECWEALAYSHTCYDGEYPPNPYNHASLLRARGFKLAGEADPLIVRAKSEGLLPDDYPDHGLVETTGAGEGKGEDPAVSEGTPRRRRRGT